MTAPARFRQADITRAMKAVFEAGREVHSVTIEPDGRIVVTIEGAGVMSPETPNPWDVELETRRATRTL